MEEKNLELLKKAIAELPQHEPEPKLWEKVEASLEFDDRLQQLFPEMPVYEPEPALWDKIEAQLEPVKEPKHFQLNTFFSYAAAVAASVVLLLAIIQVFKMKPSEKVKLTYSEEIALASGLAPAASPDSNEGLQFIQAHCSNLPEVCQKPEFKELQSQLAELEEEHKMLQQQIAVFGEDPVLIRNQIKIENLRAEFTKKLIQIIIS